VTYLLAQGAHVTPTTKLNCQNPSIRALLRAEVGLELSTEVPSSLMTVLHLEQVRTSAGANLAVSLTQKLFVSEGEVAIIGPTN
jgi:hypothetical protein